MKENFLKKALTVGAITSVGLLPNKLNGQNIENNIENNEKLKTQIFEAVQSCFENGILKSKREISGNPRENAYYYTYKDSVYDISYNLDLNYDEKKDTDIPDIDVSYTKGNLNFSLVKRNQLNSDLVFDYKDKKPFPDAETLPYDDFFLKTRTMIMDLLHNDPNYNIHPIHFRESNIKEKEEILKGIVAKLIQKSQNSNNPGSTKTK